MILITGGAYQGKTEYVRRQFPDIPITDGAACLFDEAATAKCINQYHVLIQRLHAAGRDPVAWTEQLCAENPECIILLDEIGCGIIPLERDERIRRELTGICGCIIAKHSDAVIRLVCGVPNVIKGDLL